MEEYKGLRIPAYCNHCNAFFLTIFSFEIQDIRSGIKINMPCPNCNKTAHSKAEWLLLAIDLFDELKTLKKSDLNFIKTQLLSIQSKNIRLPQFYQFKEDIANKQIKLKEISSLIPKTRSEAYAFVGIILTIITIIFGLINNNKSFPKNDPTISNVIFEQYLGCYQILPKDSITRAILSSKNAPCPCGSGKKFKRCHGLTPTKK